MPFPPSECEDLHDWCTKLVFRTDIFSLNFYVAAYTMIIENFYVPWPKSWGWLSLLAGSAFIVLLIVVIWRFCVPLSPEDIPSAHRSE
jgi:hypothetical protein